MPTAGESSVTGECFIDRMSFELRNKKCISINSLLKWRDACCYQVLHRHFGVGEHRRRVFSTYIAALNTNDSLQKSNTFRTY